MTGQYIALLFFGAVADPAALSDQAQKFAERKQFGEAERLWKSAIAADAKYFPALFNLGYFYYSHGRYAEAVTFLERAADTNPKDFNSRVSSRSIAVEVESDGCGPTGLAHGANPEAGSTEVAFADGR